MGLYSDYMVIIPIIVVIYGYMMGLYINITYLVVSTSEKYEFVSWEKKYSQYMDN